MDQGDVGAQESLLGQSGDRPRRRRPGVDVVVSAEPTFETLAPWIERVLELLLVKETALPLVNVNFPGEPKELTWARQAVRHYDGYIVPSQDPMGRRNFWFMVKPI